MKLSKALVTAFLATSTSLWAQETEKVFNLKEAVVTAQGREEKMLDVPITMSLLSGEFLKLTNTEDLQSLSDFVPGLNIRIQTPNRPSFVIRGLTSDEVSPAAQPRVSTYFNNAPISRASMAKSNLFDMERVEVVKGPQGTLFGRGAQIGGINFITKKPTSEFGGFIGVGLGNYGMKEVEGVMNIPVVANKLMIRTGGNYTYRDGYVENLSGGKHLGDLNTANARFSLRYLPVSHFRIDLVVDYQDDNNSGTPFMSKRFGGDPFSFKVSFDPGEEFYNKRSLLGTMLDMSYYINDNSYISSLTSYHDNKTDSRWDGDGTIASAIAMSEYVTANQFTQELRYNFTQNRLKGFAGGSYWREDVKHKYGFYPNEQYLAYLLFDMFPGMEGMSNYMILPNGQPNPMTALDPQLTGQPYPVPLPGEGARQEMKENTAVNSSYDLFGDLSYSLTDQFILTAGLRGAWESIKVTDMVEAVSGSAPSMLGMLVQQPSPNFLFTISPYKELSKTYFSTTWRANLKYLLNNQSMLFAGYSKGRRPPVLQPDQQGNIGELNAEKVDNFEIGYKYLKQGRLWIDVGLFYFHYNHFQAATMENMQYIIIDAGKAKSYGAEVSLHVTTCEHLDLFGNYAYIYARFDDDPANSIFAGNRFRLTPDHSFTLGFNAKAKVTRNIGVLFTPTYSYKDKVWFEDDNKPELTQEAYGLLNLNLAFRLQKPMLHVSFFCNNVTDKNYIISAGNTGMMFGVPTFVPGLPRMFGAKLSWRW